MTRLRIRVSPGSGRNEIVGRYGDAWKVRVGAPPEKGRANDAVRRLLSERLGVPLSDVGLVAGATGRDKVVELRGLSLEEAVARLEGTA